MRKLPKKKTPIQIPEGFEEVMVFYNKRTNQPCDQQKPCQAQAQAQFF
jgi:hypothetical protein